MSVDVEATIFFHDGEWLGRLATPDGEVTRKCANPAPLLRWMNEWAEGRNTSVTVTAWLPAANPPAPSSVACVDDMAGRTDA